MSGDDQHEPTTHGSLSWRDVYTAVAQMEDRMMKTLERIELKFDNVVGDHETRLRALEVNGSIEAQEALRTARAIGAKYDDLKERVDAYDNREKGIFGTAKWAQQSIVLLFGFLGALSVFLHLTGIMK